MVCHKLSNPLIWLLHYVHIDTVLVVFLLEGIEEQVETGEVGERNEFSDWCALFLSKRFEQFEVKVAHFLLCDWGDGVDWVEPNIECWCVVKVFEAGRSKLFGILNRWYFLDKFGALWQNLGVGLAEVWNVGVEVILGVSFTVCDLVYHWS